VAVDKDRAVDNTPLASAVVNPMVAATGKVRAMVKVNVKGKARDNTPLAPAVVHPQACVEAKTSTSTTKTSGRPIGRQLARPVTMMPRPLTNAT
jgi:hypothetical protein